MKVYELESDEYEEIVEKVDELEDLTYNKVVILEPHQELMFIEIKNRIDTDELLNQNDKQYLRRLFALHDIEW